MREGDLSEAFNVLVGINERRHWYRGEDDIKMHIPQIHGLLDWIHVTLVGYQ